MQNVKNLVQESYLKIIKRVYLIFGRNFMVTYIFTPIVNSYSTQFLFKKLDLHPFFFPKICVKQVHVSVVRPQLRSR